MESSSDWGKEGSEERRESRSITKQYQNNNLGLKSFIKESGMIKRRTVKAEKLIKIDEDTEKHIIFLHVRAHMDVIII